MRLEDIRTKKEFVDYTGQYGYHVIILMFDNWGIRRLGDYHYLITIYRDNHKHVYNNTTIIKEIECTTEECFHFIMNEIRKQKITKLKNNKL